MPRLSVITPSFNQGKYIEETIESVITHKDNSLEYIIIDGGSTDNTLDIIKKYEKGIDYWESEKDGGQTHAINKGFKLAKGEWLAFINSDDFYEKKAIPEFYHFVSEHPEAKWVVGNLNIIGTKREIYRLRKPEFDPEKSKVIDWITYEATSPQPSTFIHRDLYERVGEWNQNYHYAFDLEYWLRAHLSGFVITHFDKTIANFRFHDESKTHQSRLPFLNEHRQILAEFRNNFTKDEINHAGAVLNKFEAESRIYTLADQENISLEDIWKIIHLDSTSLGKRHFWGSIRKQITGR